MVTDRDTGVFGGGEYNLVMVKKSKKEMTINQLARMMQRQFADMHIEFSKEFSRVHETHKVFVDEFDRIRADIRDIKTTLGPLVRIMAGQDGEIKDLNMRLHRVERKVGITK